MNPQHNRALAGVAVFANRCPNIEAQAILGNAQARRNRDDLRGFLRRNVSKFESVPNAIPGGMRLRRPKAQLAYGISGIGNPQPAMRRPIMGAANRSRGGLDQQ
jgi:hypothetical protein